MDDAALPQEFPQEPDYSKFENYIPQFVRPNQSCECCRAKHLQCYMRRGETSCTPCATLSRDCSLSQVDTSEASSRLFNGSSPLTLRVVDENNARVRELPAGVDLSGPQPGSRVPLKDDIPGTSKRNGIRFPKSAVKILRDWLESHADNPYPSEEQKAELEVSTELKASQIANWLANARRRRKVTEKSRPKIAMSPSLRPTTAAIPIPARGSDKSWEDLNPFERWKNSPPENEPASMTDIVNAIATTDIPAGSDSASPSTLGRSKRRTPGSSNGSGPSRKIAPSTTSLETGLTSSISATSAAFSNGSSHSTHGSFNSFSSSLGGKKDRRRRRRPTAPTPRRQLSDDKKRIFQCTFCCDTFRSKYDWTRHEKSLHLSLEKWTCAPLGPIITDQESGSAKCVYCDLNNPSSDHLDSHNHRQCEEKGLDARTFYRKDHLRQHLRLFHGCDVLLPSTESWRSVTNNINSRCGFCAARFTTWTDRVDHITAHFKAGLKMIEWKGCRGLDPSVAAQVTNAMPPYLIGMESVSPVPFRASNRGSGHEFVGLDQGDSLDNAAFILEAECGVGGSKVTTWEILTVKLGKYVKDQSEKGVVLTDEMLQSAARKALYGSDDSWNQTCADNAEWLDLFKKAHGLKFIPTTVGGRGEQIPEDLETYGDLGLRIPFAIQLQAYNESHCNSSHMADAANVPEFHKQVMEKRRAGLKQMYSGLSEEGVFYSGDQRCDHEECSLNLLDVSTVDGDPLPGPRTRRWCSREITTDISQRLCHSHGLYPTAEGTIDGRSSARARGLAALSRIEALEDDSDSFVGIAPKKRYLQRHRYDLTNEQAQAFETTTGAWPDSGMMPEPIRISLRDTPASSAKGQLTAAEEDFSGRVPLQDDPSFDWQNLAQQEPTQPGNRIAPNPYQGFDPIDAAMDVDMTWNALMAPSLPIAEMPNDLGMAEVNFDDFTFDGVFDMPPDGMFDFSV